jgi:SAM-dependent methyltransferase
LGCGPGRQSLVLAAALGARVIAIDLHQPYLDQLTLSAAAAGLSHLVEPRRADMGALEFPAGSVDLVWSEGAAYILGFEQSLRLWRPLLKPAGLMAVSELSWLCDELPAEPRAFWAEAYPAMTNIEGNCHRARSAGLDLLGTLTLPESAWWDEYYGPLGERAKQLRPTAGASLAAHLDSIEREIDLFRRHSQAYGYVFYLLRVAPGEGA